MRYSALVPVLAAGLVAAAPVKRNSYNQTVAVDFNAPPGGDATILNYALTLEFLETKFYEEGLANFSQADFIAAGFPDPFFNNLQEVLSDEQTHVSTLSGILGNAAVHEATYSFPVTDVHSFVTLASVLEAVGESAYLGAAQAIVDKSTLTAAGSILTVESRHASFIRGAIGESPFPKAFGTPQDFNQVFSMAAQFIVSFAPEDPPLPFVVFPPLSVESSQSPLVAGSSPLTFTDAYSNALNAGLIKANQPVFAVFFSGLDVYYVPTTQDNSGDLLVSALPAGSGSQLPPTGQVYVVLSTADGNDTTISDDNTISGVGILEVNPVGDNTGVF